MNADGLKALFEPFVAVTVKRMFGGHGVYAEGLCFAIESGGEVFLKVDAGSQSEFEAVGSSPFIFNAKGRAMPTSFWRLPSIAHENADQLRRWAALGFAAARRAAAAKGAKKRAKAGAGAKSKIKSPT
jgi:DNA transformation protein